MLNKKAAMFGKLSQLDHSYFSRAKTAAMFGLDARIALAIFGALSVITGAALYSAIKDARITSLVAQMEEFSKAIESYYLDTGVDLKDNCDVKSYLCTDYLINNTANLPGWSGPYISGEVLAEGIVGLGDFRYFAFKCDNTLGGKFSNANCTSVCSDIKTCGIWLKLDASKVLDLAGIDALEKKIDGTVDYAAGKLRVQWSEATKTAKARLYYYIKPADTI